MGHSPCLRPAPPVCICSAGWLQAPPWTSPHHPWGGPREVGERAGGVSPGGLSQLSLPHPGGGQWERPRTQTRQRSRAAGLSACPPAASPGTFHARDCSGHATLSRSKPVPRQPAAQLHLPHSPIHTHSGSLGPHPGPYVSPPQGLCTSCCCLHLPSSAPLPSPPPAILSPPLYPSPSSQSP